MSTVNLSKSQIETIVLENQELRAKNASGNVAELSWVKR